MLDNPGPLAQLFRQAGRVGDGAKFPINRSRIIPVQAKELDRFVWLFWLISL
jgi:hypothetical protein